MTKPLLRFAALGAVAFACPLRAQDGLPAPLPWGSSGAQVSAALEAREMRVILARAGRDVHAASPDRHLQAVAVLKNDSLVGLVYFHPENAQLNALELFTRAASHAERAHGPPLCRTSGLAVWPMENARLEVRLRRARGDAAPGAEIRYVGPGYAEEMARRSASHPPPAPRTAAGSSARRSGPRLLGAPVDSVRPEPAPPEPAPVAAIPAPAEPLAATMESCSAAQ